MRGHKMVDFSKLLAEVEKLKEKPTLVLCKTQSGEERVLSLEECIQIGAKYIHPVCDELDELLTRTF